MKYIRRIKVRLSESLQKEETGFTTLVFEITRPVRLESELHGPRTALGHCLEQSLLLTSVDSSTKTNQNAYIGILVM